MGKLKKRSKLSQQRRKDGMLASSEGKKTHNESNELQKITPLITKLSSPAANDRSIALNSIMLLCDNDESARKLLLKHELVKILLTKLIHDDNDEVVVDAYGLIRNLIIEEGYDLSVHLWRSDIWTSLESAFKKAIESVGHLSDASTSSTGQALLIDYIDNLISCVGSLSTEVSIQLFDQKILPKLQESGILKFIFDLIEKRVSTKLTLTSLEFLYDLSTLSLHFIELFATDATAVQLLSSLDASSLNSLSQVYLIGLKFQIMEFKGELIQSSSDNILINSVLQELNNIYKKKVDIVSTVALLDSPLKTNPTKEEEKSLTLAKNNFKIIDLLLDLYSTVIEIKGDQIIMSPESTSPKLKESLKSFFLNGTVPFLSELITNGFKNSKVLVCLNNLSIYFKTTEDVDDSYINSLNQVSGIVLGSFTDSLRSSNVSLETTIDQLNFLTNYLEITQAEIPADQLQVSNLLKISSTFTLENSHINQLTLFTTALIAYLTIVAKASGSLEVVQEITKFIVDEKILAPVALYKSFKTASELHKKYQFLVEYTLLESINSVFELFDDDYPYNKVIFHEGELLKVLQELHSNYKQIYKTIDKSVDLELKERSEDTLTNLERFIQYKETEI